MDSVPTRSQPSTTASVSTTSLPAMMTSQSVVRWSIWIVGFLEVLFGRVLAIPYPVSHEAIVPHTAPPGFIVISLGFPGQNSTSVLTSGLCLTSGENVSGYFTLLRNGDIITTSGLVDLLGSEIELIVNNQFGGQFWAESVAIRVRSSDLVFAFTKQLYEGSVVENLPRNSIVPGLDCLRATRGDRPVEVVEYSIVSGRTDIFQLMENGDGSARLETLQPLDYETETQYLLTLSAISNSTSDFPIFARLRVFVENTNDNLPVFEESKYHAVVRDGTPSRVRLVRLSAWDPDGDRVKYHLDPEDSQFSIDSDSGELFQTHGCIPIQPNRFYHELFAFAVDSNGRRSLPATVVIETPCLTTTTTTVEPVSSLGRNRRGAAPQRTREFEIPESMFGDLLTLGNGTNQLFSFKDPGPRDLAINPVTGTVRLRDGRKLDYETEPEMTFVVVATRIDDVMYREEQGVRIKLLDVNDELPVFKNAPKPFLATVSTSAPPGTSVYQLLAQDTDENSVVKYLLESGGEDRFDVDGDTGIVRTKGSESFRLGREYEIGVAAQDVNVKTLQRSATHSLKILVGERDPQFYETLYVASVQETAPEQQKITEIKAYSHQGYPLTYELMTDAGSQSNEFAIDQVTGVVDLLRTLDYEKDPHQYHLKVKVIENGRPARSSTVNLIITLLDMNDNSPTFPLSQYIVQGIAETVAIGTDIIQVTATDQDSVTNSQLTYSVTDHSFSVQTLNNIGYIKTARRLDYDSGRCHTYNFTVIATDNGIPAHRGSANVRVSVTNVNDEDPVFTQPVEHVLVSEDAIPNTVVHVLQAYDPDGDDVSYSFLNGRLADGPFNIDPNAGIIALIGSLNKAQISYKLNIVATDNGGCCGGSTSRSSRGLVVIAVKDINNNAPRFPDCVKYFPTVLEKENVGTFVVQVKAVDLDTGANGNVTYSLVKSNDQSSDRFEIDQITGIIRTADVFDREGQIGVTYFQVTVKAQDQGNPSLAGFCTFRTKIGDKNDNPPVFNFPHYVTSIEESSIVGRRVKQVYANDRDAGDNGKVEYYVANDPSGFFAINHYSGWVTVIKPIVGVRNVQLEIEARDRGFPPKSAFVRMDIEVTETMNAYPQWVEDYTLSPARVGENAPVNTIVKRLKATSSIPDSLVNYVIQPGETLEQNGQPRSFYCKIDESMNEMIVLTYRPLDYETVPQYTLTIKAANRATNSLHNDTRLTIDVLDANDEIPQFIGLDENGRYAGSIAENLDPGAAVVTVTATDRDEFPDFKKLAYRIKEAGIDFDKFSIDRETGLVRSVLSFDCEMKKDYYITVIAEDGAQSDRPNHYPPGTPNQGEAEIHIHIADMNDNAPFFRERYYSTRVPENTEPGTVIITVTAEDKDEENRLTYSITGGNIGSMFSVEPDLGEVKIRRLLDYESGPRSYQLIFRVFDDKYANTTTIVVQVLDVNDNPPKFDNAIYNVTDAQEEEPGISKNNPKYLLSVRATDPDMDRKSRIRYGLTGQFVDDGTFMINEHTGEITLTKSLDRDYPRGRPIWNFNVLAHDESDNFQSSLTGYAEVRIIPRDVNDNAPVFDRNRLIGRVPEHSRAGMTVLTVIATDADSGNNGSVTYSLKQVPMKGNQPLFSIDSYMGLISTILNNALDREVQSIYHIIVQAKDRGSPPMSASATVTIYVDDVNDHSPRFTQKLYHATMSESFQKSTSVASLSATDPDIGINSKLTYTLEERDREFFFMTSIDATNTGVLKVFKPVDYDSLPSPVFNLTVYVHDIDPTHVDTAYVEVQVTDFNDNSPVFMPNSKKVAIYENVTIGTTLHKFLASDKDTGVNQQFFYSVDRVTDPNRQFSIDGSGLVTTARLLDRETLPGHRVNILAIDKGNPPQTGTGILIISLMDVNDNYPEFADVYRPVIYENYPAGRSIVEVSATDRDTLTNGPPFEFWLPCAGSCPCHANPTCHEFSFRFVPGGGDNGFGSGVITSLRMFDRELRKEYYVPIVMKDSGNPPMSGTNTLTVVIGDVNDHKHHPGHKNIYIYSYKGWKGIFENVPLGNVYAEDADDWDIPNKTFTFYSASDDPDSLLFRLDQDTGELSTNGQLHQGEYSFRVKVYDIVWKREVISTVDVFLKEIGDDAIANSGSLRIRGVTAEEFIARMKAGNRPDSYHKSKYDLLRERLAQKVGSVVGDVCIFSIANHHSSSRTIDVRYAVSGTPFVRPAKLDGLVLAYREEFEDLLGVKILMSPIDECLVERCDSTGCSNAIVSTGHPILVNTNSTSFVGVMTFAQMDCVCSARSYEDNRDIECQSTSCLNGGTCLQREFGFLCECVPGFDGPRCQQTRHSFRGSGWAWYSPPAQCENSHLSLEFITTKENGLLLYHGPIKDLTLGDAEDFFLLELRNGYPLVRINYGSGETKVSVDGRDRSNHLKMKKLNDGYWHRIDIFLSGKEVRLIVDQCSAASATDFTNDHIIAEDRRACEAVGEVPGDSLYINVNAPLQLGGRSNQRVKYPQNVLRDGFSGCVKNLVFNGEIYDLYIGTVGESWNSEDGCLREDNSCGSKDLATGTKCSPNGTCVGSFHSAMRCECRPGFRGPYCNIATTVKDFHQQSFIEWDFQDRFYEQILRDLRRTDIQLMFRTRRDSGQLFKIQNAQKSEYMALDITRCRISFRFNFGSGEKHLALSFVNVSDGVWHSVSVERTGQWAVIRLDGGEGRFFNESLGLPGDRHEIRVSQRNILAGGEVRFPSSNSPPLIDNDFTNGCMNDIRYNGEWLPMEFSQNRESRAADLQQRSQNVEPGCPSDVCSSILSPMCLYGTVCVDLWRFAECRCPRGRKLVTHGSYDLCENINECLIYPGACHNGKCHDTEDGYYCQCYVGYAGPDCLIRTEMATAFISRSALTTIIACAAGVFVLLSILIIVNRCRQPESYSVVLNPDEDVRENIIHYNEEGVGEEDQTVYDINKLKKPLQNSCVCVPSPVITDQKSTNTPRHQQQRAADCETLDNFINNRLREIDRDPNAPPYDTIREYAYEGSATSTRSLSSIESAQTDGKDDCASCEDDAAAAAQDISVLPSNNCNCSAASAAAFNPAVNATSRREINEQSMTTDI